MLNIKKLESYANVSLYFLLIVYIFFIVRFDFEIFKNSLKPDAGLEKAIKREKVLELRNLVRKHNIDSFDLDPYFMRRPGGFSSSSIITTTYPSRYIPGSKDLMIFNENSSNFINCDIIDSEKIVSYVICP